MKSLYKAKSGHYRECNMISNNGNTAKIQFRFAKNPITVESQRIVKYDSKLKDKTYQLTQQLSRININKTANTTKTKKKPTTKPSTSTTHPRRPTTRKRKRKTAFAETENNRYYPYTSGEPNKRRRRIEMDQDNEQQQQNDDQEQQLTIEEVLQKYQLTKQEIKNANKMTLIGLRATLTPRERQLIVNTNGLLKVSQLQIWVGLETEAIEKAQEQAEKDKMEVAGMNERLDRVTKELERERARKENKEDTVK